MRKLPLTCRDVACDRCRATVGGPCVRRRRPRRDGRAAPPVPMMGFHLVRHAALLEHQRELARREFAVP